MLDLALAVARKDIVCHWKSNTGPSCEPWQKEEEHWARQEEEEALLREETCGMRKRPLSTMWREVYQPFVEAAGSQREDEPIMGNLGIPAPREEKIPREAL